MTLLLLHRLIHLRRVNPEYTETVQRIERIRSSLVCPMCRGGLTWEEERVVCSSGHSFARKDAVVPLLAEGRDFSLHEEQHLTGVNWLKSFLKQFPGIYYTVWHIFCPALMLQNGPQKLLSYSSKDALLGDIGSGPDRVSKDMINVDIFPFPGVDVVASADRLPFKDETFDGLVTESMLEHVANPFEVAQEMARVLKPGGVVYASAPFIHPFHASPDDFNRFTTSGLRELFPGFDVVRVGVRSGPWSALLLFLAYWFGVIFSFGSRKIAPFLAHIFMLILGPLKILDPLFASMPGAEAVSTHLFIIARKRPSTLL